MTLRQRLAIGSMAAMLLTGDPSVVGFGVAIGAGFAAAYPDVPLEEVLTSEALAELDVLDTTQWYPKVRRKDYSIGLNLTGNGIDDPDQAFYENYVCGSESNYDGYCNPEIDKLFDRQSMEADQEKRRKLVWEIERHLAEDVARPVLYHNRSGTCCH